jgi:hypothetical protein
MRTQNSIKILVLNIFKTTISLQKNSQTAERTLCQSKNIFNFDLDVEGVRNVSTDT